jgi:hypothetical protein
MPADSARSSRVAVFDHDAPRARRARRPAPDWGGDELFDHVPRRRFARAEGLVELPPAPGAGAGGAAVAELAPEPAGPLEAERPRSVLYAEPPPEGGRRTVTITGHPGRVEVVRRERGPRTVEQRIHASPDRVAAWACALGVLLICLALLT